MWEPGLRVWALGTQRALCPGVTLAPAPPASSLQAVQSLGNLGQQLGQGKELWMAPLHPFLLQSISRVRDFLDQLVDVEGEEGEFLRPRPVPPLGPRDLPFHLPSPTPTLRLRTSASAS